MDALRDVLVVLTVVTSALTAGLLSAFAYAVMPGLQRTAAPVAVAAMQRINVAIMNPLFALIFLGPLVFGGLAVLFWWDDPLRWWLVVGLALASVTVAITLGLNVPLNNRLDAAGDVAPAEATAVWADFIGPWVRWNVVRAVASTAGVAVIVVGLMQAGP
ncbi:MAG: anthrone oxygenase family protein [Actinomycetota bacterium]|nr:anthrone oxygenase family protein [Actinomycetota bacterium]